MWSGRCKVRSVKWSENCESVSSEVCVCVGFGVLELECEVWSVEC